MSRLFVMGLTGPTGAGKSEVARVFAQKGCVVIDADVLSRRAVEKGTACLQRLTEVFSADILLPDGSLDRRALATVAFASEEKTALLNSIVHPEVIRMTAEALKAAEAAGKTVAVIDAPLLFQAGMETVCHCTVAVLAPAEIRLNRICERDGLTVEQAQNRMNAQPDDAFYEERATVVLRNNGDLPALRLMAERWFDQLGEWWDETCDQKVDP